MLAALIVRAGRTVPPGELAEAYWGEALAADVGPAGEDLGRSDPLRDSDSGAISTLGSEYRARASTPPRSTPFAFERLVSTARAACVPRRARSRDRRLSRARSRSGVAHALHRRRRSGNPESSRRTGWTRSATSANEELLEARLAEGEHRVPHRGRRAAASAKQPLRENRWAILALANYRAEPASRSARDAPRRRGTARGRARDRASAPDCASSRLAMLRQDPALSPRRHPPRVSPRSAPTPVCEAFRSPTQMCSSAARPTSMPIRDRMRAGALVTDRGRLRLGQIVARPRRRPAPAPRSRRVAVVTAGGMPPIDLRSRIAQPGAANVLAIDQAEAIFQLRADRSGTPCSLDARRPSQRRRVRDHDRSRSDFLDRLRAVCPSSGTRSDAACTRSARSPPSRFARPSSTPLSARAPSRARARRVDRAGCRGPAAPRSLIFPTPPVETWIRREGCDADCRGVRSLGRDPRAIAQSAETSLPFLRRRRRRIRAARSCSGSSHRGADGASVRRTRCAGSPCC